MVTLYRLGTAEVIDSIRVDYVVVNERDVPALMAVGWVKTIAELK